MLFYLHVYCKVCNKKLMLSTLKSNLFILLKMLSNIYYFILFICHAHTTFQQPPPWLFRCRVPLNNRPQSLNPPIASSLPCFLTFSLTFPPPHLTRRRRLGSASAGRFVLVLGLIISVDISTFNILYLEPIQQI